MRPAEKPFDTELVEHPAHGKHALVARLNGNIRNGRAGRYLKGEFGELPIGISALAMVRYLSLRPVSAAHPWRAAC